MSDKKLKVVDFEVLLGTGISVKNPDGEVVILDDECGISVFELEDHRYQPSMEEWYNTGYFKGDEEFLEVLHQAGFCVHTDTNFYFHGKLDGYCWPWEVSERQVEKPNPVKLVVTEMELWLDHYDKDSEIYADLCDALDALRKTY